MMTKISTFLIFSLLSSYSYAFLSPIEGALTLEKTSNYFYFQNTTNVPILYEAKIFNRYPNKEGYLKREAKKKPSYFNQVEIEDIDISPKRFVLKAKEGRRVSFAIKKKALSKYKKAGMYLVGIKMDVIRKVPPKKDNKVPKKMVSSAVSFLPEYTTSIILFNDSKKNLYSKVELVDFSVNKKNVIIKMKRDERVFGLGIIDIDYSTDGKTWTNVHQQELRFFSLTATRKIELKKSYTKGFFRVSYKPIARYNFDFKEYFNKVIKLK